jgi:hypothetical protein
VRAGQDLLAASLDRMRLEAYLAAVKANTQTDPKLLKIRAENLARSLGIKVDQQCFDKPTDQQAPCLAQHTDGLVLDDANTQSMVTQLANGATGDLMNQLSYSTLGGAGSFSPYVGAILDTARILSSLHTAHFQYIPALALPTKDTLNLRLNVPPSFRDPKSVVVVALPPVGPARMPGLRAVNPEEKLCAQKPGLVLPADGSPAVFSTQMAYNLTLHIEGQGQKPLDLDVKPDPAEGGIVPANPLSPLAGGDLTAVLKGKWGFDDWEGPHFHLHAAEPGKWTLAAADQSALVVGREDTLHLHDDSSVCVERVEEQPEKAKAVKLTWTSPKPDALDVAVPLKDAAPGPVNLEIFQYGLKDPEKLPLRAYAEAASLDRLTLSAGDQTATLRGKRLDEVAKADLEGVALKPGKLRRVEDFDELPMSAGGSTANLDAGKNYQADVQLEDGRELKVPVTVESPRPQVTLLNKGVQPDAAASGSPVHFASADDLPLDGRLVFFIKSRVPVTFPRNEKIEVSAVDGSFQTTLSLADASLMLEDSKTAMGSVEPLARFGGSAFGPIELRPVSADGVAGEWLALGTLVRVPGFKDLKCPRMPAKPCMLTGTNLFLASSIGSAADMSNSIDVPPDFTGTQLPVPHPVNGQLYVRLRDDDSTVQTVTLPVTFDSRQAARGADVPTPQAPAQQTAPPAANPAAPATPAPAPENPAPTTPAPVTPGKPDATPN